MYNHKSNGQATYPVWVACVHGCTSCFSFGHQNKKVRAAVQTTWAAQVSLVKKGFFYARAPVMLNDPLKSFTIWSILDFCCKILQYMYYTVNMEKPQSDYILTFCCCNFRASFSVCNSCRDLSNVDTILCDWKTNNSQTHLSQRIFALTNCLWTKSF